MENWRELESRQKRKLHKKSENMKTSRKKAAIPQTMLLILLVIGDSPLYSQMCFRGKPLPDCTTFFITEFGAGLFRRTGGKGNPADRASSSWAKSENIFIPLQKEE
jgi:hypothetical protein